MLSRVINYVPYDERPPQKPSIFELLIRLFCMQEEYFRPLLGKATTANDSSFKYTSLESYVDQQETKEGEEFEDIEQLLQQIAEDRNEIIKLAKELNNGQWNLSVMLEDEEVCVMDLVNQIVEKETSILSNISEQVMVYSQQRSNQREIQQRRKHREDNSN